MNIEVNYLGIALAGVTSMIVGFLWYSPTFFGRPWMKLMGYTEAGLKKAQKEMGNLYGISFVGSLLMAFVLSHVMTLSMNFYHTSKFSTGLNTAFWMWIGFVMPVQMTTTIFGDKKWPLFAINTGYQLASLLGMAMAIALV